MRRKPEVAVRNGKRMSSLLFVFHQKRLRLLKKRQKKRTDSFNSDKKTVLGKQINARIDEDFLKELMRLGRLQKHLFVEGKRTGDKEYAEVLVAITELANTLRRDLMGR